MAYEYAEIGDEARWSDFLTERDRALLDATTWAKSDPFGLGQKAAVLVVDAYYAALGFPRAPLLDAVAEWPQACGEDGWAAVDATRELLRSARAAAMPVVYFAGAGPKYGRGSKKSAAMVRARSAGPDSNGIVTELTPEDSDIVIGKVGPSAFFSSPLDTLLRRRGCDTVLVCGESTSGCVRATVVDAHARGYYVGIVHDCCFDRFQSSHWVSLFDMHQKYADVISCSTALEYLADRRAVV
jgi:nicotinamidase-related amidase